MTILRTKYSFLILSLVLPASLYSTIVEKKTFIREYTYTAGEADSKLTARAIALEQVKKLLLEAVSTYIESFAERQLSETFTHGKSDLKEITKEQLISISAGITETEILEEKWNGEVYWLKVKITLDTDYLEQNLGSIVHDRTTLISFSQVQKEADRAILTIDSLKKDLANAKSEAEKLRIAESRAKSIKKLTYGDLCWKAMHLLTNEKTDKETRFAKILFYTDEAIELNTSLGFAYMLRGAAKEQLREDYQGAINDFTRVIKLDSVFFSYFAYLRRAIAKKALNDCKGAIEDFTIAIKMNSTSGQFFNTDSTTSISDLLVGRGTCRQALGNYKEALEDYNESIKLNSKNSNAYLRRGQVKSDLNDLEGAAADLSQSIVLYQELGKEVFKFSGFDTYLLAEAYQSRGLIRILLKEYQQAISDFEMTLKLSPDFYNAYRYMGFCYYLIGNIPKAIELHIKAAKSGDLKAQEWLKEKGISWGK